MVTLDPVRGVAEALLRHYAPPAAPAPKWSTPGELAKALDPTTVQTPALDLIDRELVQLAVPDGGVDRLMVYMAPQEGKSVRVSHRFAEWLLIDNPDRRIAIVSYADEMARRWGSDIKLDAQTFDGTDGTVDLGIRLRADSRAAGRWQIEGHKGGVYCVGIAGALTGKPVDCMRGDTRILTEFGYARIDAIHQAGPAFPRVLSFNHDTGRAEWRPVVASRAIPQRDIVEVHTAAGRVIRCTPDHRVYVEGGGYIAAADLQPGARLRVAGQSADPVRELRGRVHPAPLDPPTHQAGDSAVLLAGLPQGNNDGGPDVRRVRGGVLASPVRGREGQASGVRAEVLLQAVLPGHDVRSARRRAASAPDTSRHDRTAAHHTGDGADTDRAASLLQRRGGIAVRRRQPDPRLRRLRQGPQVQGRDVPRLLPGGAGLDLADGAVHAVRHGVPADAGRGREEEAGRSAEQVLLEGMPRQVDVGAQRQHRLSAVRREVRRRPRSDVLLAQVPEGVAPGEEKAVLALQAALHLLQRAASVLLAGVRERRTLPTDDRRGQLALQGRDQLRGMVPQDASADLGAGREAVPGLRSAQLQDPRLAGAAPVGAGDPPPERGPGGQPAGEPDHGLRAVPRRAPQVDYDTVHVVRHLHGERHTVYDLQVAGNRNFFADEVLVHNCLIIDDPLKNLEEAQSAKYRDRFKRFWQGVCVPRLGPGSICVLIQTRWHEDDAGGWLQKQEPGRWRVVSIPAIAESPDDPLGRKVGEPMISARGNRDWARIRESAGEHVWAALYQQRPAPAEGGLFKRKSFRYWHPMPIDPSIHGITGGQRLDLGGRTVHLDDCWRFLTVDLAASTKTSADYTAAGAWAISPDGDLILLEADRARIEETDHWGLVRPLRERWAADTVFVESRMFGTTMVIDATRAGVPVAELKADTDKVTRALPATARADAGRLWLPSGEASADVVDELLAFPNAAHDDYTDVVSYAARAAAAHWVPAAPLPDRATPRGLDQIDAAFAAATGGSAGVDLMNAPLV